ncbi:MAG: hypothetical protein D6702_03215 [Planctomycetota bacterium]|nr:MAG: hypothetical protein D6702_03215 [Planctomycetota bacterium]
MKLSSLLLLTALLAPPLAAQDPALLSPTWLPGEPGVGTDLVTVRSRLVEIDTDLLRHTLGRTGGSGVIEVALFDDLVLTAVFDRAESAYGGGLIWRGHVVGDPESELLFSLVDEAVCASIHWAGRLYRLAPAGNGVHRVSLVDEQAFMPCATDDRFAVQSPPAAAGGAGARAGNPDIDVMVPYTTEAKNVSGGVSGITAKINLAITETNDAYQFSQVSQRLVLVHIEEMVGYTEPSSFSQILTDLRGKHDGKMDNVHSLRDQYAADCVSLICKNNAYCGIAYLMTNVSPSFESSAFSVVNYSCATGYYSFGHELGHNMGSAHDRQNAGGAAYSYSYGYRTSNNRYRTIMAYSPGTRIKRFSSPLVTYAGYTMGTATEDNARSLNNTAATVADWRIGGPSAPVLTVPTLFAGAYAVIDVDNCTAGGTVYLAYSLTGGGPTNTNWGTASLSDPIHSLPPLTADGAGHAAYATTVPANAAGVTVWLQALDLTGGLFSNGVQTTIL